MPERPFEDPFREIRAIERARFQRERARGQAEQFDEDAIFNLVGIARSAPWMRVGPTLALARAVGGPDHQIVRAFALEDALQRTENEDWRPLGEVVNSRSLRPGDPRNRVQRAVDRANRAGLVNELGYLTSPRGSNQRRHRVFQEVKDAFETAGLKLPYVDPDGARHVIDPDAKAPLSFDEWSTSSGLNIDPDERQAEYLRYADNYSSDTLLESDIPLTSEQIADLSGETTEGGTGISQSFTPGGPGGRFFGELRQAEAGRGRHATSVGATYGALVDTTRGAMMAMDAPVQELQGAFRTIYAAASGEGFNPQLQSDAAISVQTGLESGEGFFVDPDSALARERNRREAEYGQIAGHNITVGRALAQGVGADPDSTAFTVLSGLTDAGVQLADPTAFALNKLGKLRDTRKLFNLSDEAVEAAGGIRGLRRMTHGPTRAAWMEGSEGQQVIEGIANTRDPYDLWRFTNRKLDRQTVTRLADTTDPAQVRDVLEPHLGTTFRSTGDVWDEHAWVARSGLDGPRAHRWRGQLPGRAIDTEDAHSALVEAERFMRNAELDEQTVARNMNDLFHAQTRSGQLDVLENVMRSTEDALVSHGISRDVASQTTRLFKDTHEAGRLYFVDEFGDPVRTPQRVLMDGEEVKAIGPHLPEEVVGRYIPLPDPRAIKRLGRSRVNRMLTVNSQTGNARAPIALLDKLQNEIWKPMQLIRLAYPVRVIAEEQMRMGAARYESMFRHPVSYVSWALGRKGSEDIAGGAFAESEAFQRALTRGGVRGDTRPGIARTSTRTLYRKTDQEREQFIDAWASELTTLRNSRVVQQMLADDWENPTQVVNWLTRGEGRPYLDELSEAGMDLSNDQAVMRYLGTVADRINIKTGNSSELMEALRTGQIGKHSMLEADHLRSTQGFRRRLNDLADRYAPETVVGERLTYTNVSDGIVQNAWRDVTDRAFGLLMARRTDELSRSPVFRQAYWNRMRELLPYADESTQATILRRARADNIDGFGSRASRRSRGPRSGRTTRGEANLNQAVERGEVVGDLGLNEVDELAKGYALDETKNLLYDLSNRSQIFDAMRLVLPFGEAWKEVLGRWAHLAVENPASIRRAQQVIEGARGEEFGEFMGAPEGQGFFYKNQWGDEVFTYPFSSFVTRKLAGVPIPLTGSVKGLNFVSQILPGLGPVAQLPAAWFLQTNPFNIPDEFMREAEGVLFPYGSPYDEAETSGGVGSGLGMLMEADWQDYLPSWARKMVQGATGGWDEATKGSYNTAVMEVATYLASTGEYDLSTEAGQQRLLEDARARAGKFSLIRGAAQFGAPSAPAPEWMVESPDGGLLTAWSLRDEYRRLQEEDWETADQVFLNRWGEDLSLIMQSKSRTTTPGIQATLEFADWARRNEDLQREYPGTWAFFGPQNGTFEQLIYQEQIRDGERQRLTPDQWLSAANDRLGRMYMEQARRQAGENPSDEIRQWLRETESWVRDTYPGYGQPLGFVERPDIDQQMHEIREALSNRTLMSTPVGEGLRTYMERRDEVFAAASELGYTTLNSAAMRPGRDYLRELGDWTAVEYPGFGNLFDQVLSREFKDDDEQLALTGASDGEEAD